MKKLSRLCAAALALLMAVCVAPFALAAAPNAVNTGDVLNYWNRASLDEAMAPNNAAIAPIEWSTSGEYPWTAQYDYDLTRWVGGATFPDSGSFTSIASFDVTLTNAAVLTFDYLVGAKNLSAFRLMAADKSGGDAFELLTVSTETTSWTNASVMLNSGSYTVWFSLYYGGAKTVADAKGGDPVCGAWVTNFEVRDLSLDSALNAPGQRRTFSQYGTEPSNDCTLDANRYYMRSVAAGENSTTGVTLSASGYEGDVLTFDYLIQGDEMYGAYFTFGTLQNGQSTNVALSDFTTGGAWLTFTYTLPATGNYTFVWMFECNDSADFYCAVDNVKLASGFTLEYALNVDYYSAARYTGSDWVVDYGQYGTSANDTLLHAKTPAVADNGSATLVSNNNMVAAGSVVTFDYYVSTEDGCDLLTFYVNGSEIFEASGLEGWQSYSYTISATGLYSFEWVYSKDSSLGDNEDLCCVDNVNIPAITLDAALNVSGGTLHFEYDADYAPWETAADIANSRVIARSVCPYDNQQAILTSSITCLAGTVVSFDYFVSSQASDTLIFMVDGWNARLTASGTTQTDWQSFSFMIPTGGTHELSWTYIKDASAYDGDDRAYIDDVNVVYGVDIDTALNVASGTVDFDNPDEVFKGVDDTANSGRVYAYAYQLVGDASITFAVDAEANSYLTFDYMFDNDGTDTAFNNIFVYIDGNLIAALDNQSTASDEWAECSVPIGSAGAHTIELRYTKAEDANADSGAMIDDVFVHVQQPQSLLGDVNCSGNIDFTDVAWLYGSLVNTVVLSAQGLINADYDGDGTIGFTDVAMLYYALTGTSNQ